MASSDIQIPTKSQRRFPRVLLGGIGLVALVISLGEHDRRGLLLYNQPEALAVGELDDGGYPVIFGPLGGVGTGRAGEARDPRRIARLIPGRSGTAVQGTTPGGGAVGGMADPTGLTETGSAPVGGTQTAAFDGGRGSAIGNVPSFGSAAGPAAVIIPVADGGGPVVPPVDGGGGGAVVPPVDGGGGGPVVPAVPEPASWMLMIVGIGALGAALRKRSGGRGVMLAN